jgi:hypothetical protein
MKIAILTQPLRYNYGGILQDFALQTVLRRMGHDVVTLDPQRYYYRWWRHIRYSVALSWRKYLSKCMNDKPLGKDHFLLWAVNYLLRHSLFWRIKWDVFDKKEQDNVTCILGKNTFPFIDRYIKRQEYVKLEDMVSPSDYDAFVVGSDQVWRPEYNSNLSNMFLDFTKGWNVRRLAYAASFGVDSWSADADITERCKQFLKQFDFVSVRESSGIKLCKDLFDVEAEHLLDPTLLLTKEDYFSLLHLDKVPKSKGNLLVYILDYNEDKKKLIQQIVDRFHLVPFRVNSDVEDYGLDDINKRIQPPAEQWLRGFYDADYVVTDSFHACVFSIIFGKPFVVYANNRRGTTRFESLLRQFSLTNCLVSTSEEFQEFSDYSPEISKRLEELRKEALNRLKKTLA